MFAEFGAEAGEAVSLGYCLLLHAFLDSFCLVFFLDVPPPPALIFIGMTVWH